MNITEQTTVAAIAAALPSSVRVFQRHGIDFCCGGKRPLAQACAEHGLSFADLTHAIESAAATPVQNDTDWSRAPLRELITHIVARYHDRLREELPRIEAMAAKVAQVHGDRAHRLRRLEAIVTELSVDLQTHMRKEEVVLFPAIAAMESGARKPSAALAAPISVMEDDHDRAGELLAERRTLTDGDAAPEWACGTFRALYDGLAELESDMHVHVHLENNVLFPRSLHLTVAAPTTL